jgi:diadenosine tetraphosphatase ApaH/serine/threonine PP2A family protein phosphatase
MRIGVVGDIHANARALEEALDVVQSRPIDQLVFLGDLLTYGPDPQRVLEIVADEAADGAILLLGNHDAMYFDLLRGDDSYYEGLPAWIRESVDWTLRQLGDGEELYELDFRQDWVVDTLLAAHANPFPADAAGFPDWRYLNHANDYADAARALRERDLRIGVFGHTHRARIVEWPSAKGFGDEQRRSLYAWREKDPGDAVIVNAGAIGQPRSKGVGPKATVCWVSLEDEVDIELMPVEYDVAGHLESLQGLPMSDATIEKLSSFFQP